MDEQNNSQINTSSNIKPIHTYESDMADLVRDQEASVIKIALAEQKKREMGALRTEIQGEKNKNIFWIIGGVILIGLAIWGTTFLIQKGKDSSAVTQVQTKDTAIISYDDQLYLDASRMTTKEDFSKAIIPLTQKNQKPDSITALFLLSNTDTPKTFVSTNDFFLKMNSNIPGALLRSLSDNFMAGLYQPTATDSKPHLFLVFQTKDNSIAFAGMLEWEKTMLADLFTIFNIGLSQDNAQLLNTPFKDIIISNKDARVLTDIKGQGVLYYIFIDKNTFVITDTVDAINQILSRFFTKNIKPL